MPVGTEKTALLGAAAGGLSQYFGDGSDGALDTTGDVTHTVQNKSGSYDGDMVVMQYTSLDINSGHTMTVDQPCRGMFIYVTGNCEIAGTLHLDLKGGNSNPTTSGGHDSSAVNANGLRLPMLTASGSDTLATADFAGSGDDIVTAVAFQAGVSGNGTIFKVAQEGGSGGGGGGAFGHNWACGNGSAGTAGATSAATISSGGGGGASALSNSAKNSTGGAGGTGGAFSGGSGGAGNDAGTGNAGGSYGGAGGNGSCPNCHNGNSAGGAGNPGGNSCGGGNCSIAFGASGVGGLIWLVVGGDLIITGTISADGGPGRGAHRASGGSGAGAIMILYAGTLSNSGSVAASGGSGGGGGVGECPNSAGAGGAGGVHLAQVSAA